ncbi:MAG: hypothetical protein KatS3mg113_0439 [Planctomycetaceae bacterium]|nr:MAG: hypothetical protein KatS3mg113_0439 [Planctomycetaceae bacterium]
MSQILRVLMVVRDREQRDNPVGRALWSVLKSEPQLEVLDVVTTEQLPSPCPAEMVLVVGGDGTILRTCRQMAQHQLPILGVNQGRLGFLADLSPQELQQRLPELCARQYQVVHHLMFSCEWWREGQRLEQFHGLNEVAILSAGSLQMLRVDLSIDGKPVTTFRGDGLLLATPVGSTAHSLAAGGPILKQDLLAFVVTPISPHTLTNRPLVDRAEAYYIMSVPEAAPGVTLVIDGQIRRELQAGDEVHVRQAPMSFQLVKFHQHNYYATLHRKLGWGGQPPFQG